MLDALELLVLKVYGKVEQGRPEVIQETAAVVLHQVLAGQKVPT